MLAYKKYITIEDPNRVVLLDLPFRAGQRVEVVVIAEDEVGSVRLQELRTLFKVTQELPQAQAVSEDDIAAEIAAYRAER